MRWLLDLINPPSDFVKPHGRESSRVKLNGKTAYLDYFYSGEGDDWKYYFVLPEKHEWSEPEKAAISQDERQALVQFIPMFLSRYGMANVTVVSHFEDVP